MKPQFLLGVAFLAAIVVFGVAFFQQQGAFSPAAQTRPATSPANSTQTVSSDQPQASAPSSSSSTSAGTPGSYTMAQVAQHASATSCWTAINGNVYDLTNWIYQHPGGPQAILSICGTDGSAAFNAVHGGQSQPEQELQNFYIGTLTS